MREINGKNTTGTNATEKVGGHFCTLAKRFLAFLNQKRPIHVSHLTVPKYDPFIAFFWDFLKVV